MPSSFDRLVEVLPSLAAFHSPSSPVYDFVQLVAKEHVKTRFGEVATDLSRLEPFGALTFPYHRMGAIDSVDLFGLDELILFAFYWSRRERYRTVADIGANLGLHSIVMDRCGFSVRSYEPDPTHFAILESNLAGNSCTRVSAVNAAVSNDDGEAEFVRVLGNTTSSHLSGSKERPYGELQRFNVKVAAIAPIMAWADLLKLDVEGHERQVVCATTAADWERTDMMLEVGSPDNAREIFCHCAALKLRMFAQRSGWSAVGSEGDMPTSYRDGSLFISGRGESPWSR